MDIKGVIFDLDGTLFDTEKYVYPGWKEHMKNYGIDLMDEATYGKRFTGRSIEFIADSLIEEYNLKVDDFEKFLAEKSEIGRRIMFSNPVELMPYVEETVKYLSENNFILGAATAGPRESSERKMQSTGLDKYFEAMVTASDVEETKPSPVPYITVAKNLGLDVSDLIAVEDTETGVESASRAYIKTFAIPTESTRSHDFTNAFMVLNNMGELLDWIKNNVS